LTTDKERREFEKMNVNEIFFSIQGESTFAGMPCVFIRLSGCDLRCRYCDTEYAFAEGRDMTVPEILAAVRAWPARLALVTGGEPMLQPTVRDLFRDLLESGYTVLLETGGHRSLEGVDPRVHKIMDFKCPSSGMESRNDYTNARYLTPGDELKFVIGDREDFDWACRLIRRLGRGLNVGQILFSPVHGSVSPAELADWVLACGLPVRMQLQLHKYIWPDIKRGV
jgi:7-carboxy-7-deazaguanine synthase